MHGFALYRRFGRVRSLRSDRAWLEPGRYVATKLGSSSVATYVSVTMGQLVFGLPGTRTKFYLEIMRRDIICRGKRFTLVFAEVADKIRNDKRVTVIERTNLRYLPGLPQKVDVVTLDLSFISILKVMPAVMNVMNEDATLVTLVKPQFEARRSQVGRGGIVRDPEVHQEVLEKIINGIERYGFTNKGFIESPIKGADGNIEFLVRFDRGTVKGEEEEY
ncbi:hypothetical protein F2Q70_00030090 [Brassica cretica]|uniref:Ribosomal RNA methyltransferase FtsJ domain-containing protein n=1 Tax=Brassica cretica TaxID=69181 RepID=A0A8S9FPT5_BRACR|nr:hypothetical protein F2Q70_00030090 [Brassica cretica]